jgi:hypothetical protein
LPTGRFCPLLRWHFCPAPCCSSALSRLVPPADGGHAGSIARMAAKGASIRATKRDLLFRQVPTKELPSSPPRAND